MTPYPLSAQVDETAGQGLVSRKEPNPLGALSADNPLPPVGYARRDTPPRRVRCGGTLPQTRILGRGRRDLVATTGLHEFGGGDGDFAHWRRRFGGGLYTPDRSRCTKSRLNRAASVQSRAVRERASVQSRTLRTGVVQTGFARCLAVPHHGSTREFRRHFAGTDPREVQKSLLLTRGRV